MPGRRKGSESLKEDGWLSLCDFCGVGLRDSQAGDYNSICNVVELMSRQGSLISCRGSPDKGGLGVRV